jgi:DoxX-like family
MKTRAAAYWTTTGLIALALLSGGAASVARAEPNVRGMAELGYPAYLLLVLGTFKLAGVLAILAPRLALVKEWAYAGVAFDLTGAAASHAFAGHPAAKIAVPLALLAIAVASWALRPASRRLVAG